MATRPEYEKVYIASIVFAMVILAGNIYYYCHPLLSSVGLTFQPVDYVMQGFRRSGVFATPFRTKLTVLLLLCLSTIVRSGKGKAVDKRILAGAGVLSLALYLIPFRHQALYLVFTLLGSTGLVWTFAMISRLFSGFHIHDNDLKETFPQQEIPVENEWSVNLPTKYYYQGKWHDGNISVVNPFRGTLIIGSAGSGKSFSVFNPYIEQMIAKGYTMMLYDFKMPDLTKVVYNALLRNRDRYPKEPRFYCINFKDPQHSHRCNPLAPRYLNDIVDASETANVVMAALNKGNDKKDFFWLSAQQIIGDCIWYLRTYVPPGGEAGDWCDFPHAIELMNVDTETLFSIVSKCSALESKMKVFEEALKSGAMDQLQGQVASGRIPLNDIMSPSLYWMLSGDDFNMDINDPDDPKVVCIGNDPDRQNVYGAALSLITFRVIKRINHPGKLPCAMVIDEMPTISIQGLAGLMSTARSNKVATVLGVQDLSQIVADYGDKAAENIISLPANVFVGASSQKTAEKYSKEFGREFRRQESQTRSSDNESVSISYHEEEVMPIRKITTLKQGTFVGKVALDYDSPIEQPFFCGAIQIDLDEYKEKQRSAQAIPVLTDFGLERVEENLKDPDVLRTVMVDYNMERLRKERRKEERKDVSRNSESDLITEAYALTERMTEEQVRRAVDEMLPVLRQREVDRIVEDNYIRIKQDIQWIVQSECYGNAPQEYEN